MQARSGIQMPAPIYHRDFVDAYELMYNDYINRLIEEQLIEAEEWNRLIEREDGYEY